MIKINKYPGYYEALFLGGNLYAFSLNDLLKQLFDIYEFQPFSIFNPLNLN